MLKSFMLIGLISSTTLFAEASPYEFYGELGTSFGGDEVATNNNGGLGGDNYNAGGGAVFGLGATYSVSDRIDARGLAAYRYQGGDGSNSGAVFEGSALYKFTDKISAGVGIHSDIKNEVETAQGNTIGFKSAVGPMAVLDWKISPKIALGAKYILMDYETDLGAEYEGDQATVYVRFFNY